MGNPTKSTDREVDLNSKYPAMVPTFGRGLLLAAGALNFGCGLSIPVSLSVMFLDWQHSFSTSRAVTAAVHSTCVGILFGGGVLAGYVINKFGARISFILGTCLASLGMFLGAFATSIPFLLVSVGIVAGCGCCLIQLPCIPCCTQPFRTNQAVAIAVLSAGGAVVSIVVPYLYDYLIQTYSWRGAFIIISGQCLNTLVPELVLTSYMPSPRPPHPLISPPGTRKFPPDSPGVATSKDVNSEGTATDKRGLLVVADTAPDEMLEEASTEIRDVGENETEGNGKDYENHVGESYKARGSNGKLETQTKDHDREIHKGSDKASCTETQLAGGNGESNLEAPDPIDIQIDPVEIDAQLSHSRTISIAHLRDSPWKFLLDPLAWALLAFLGFTLGGLFSTQMLAMDIAATKGFPEHGLLILMTGIITGLVGKVLSGVFGLCRRLPSFLLLAASGGIGSVAVIFLGLSTSLVATAVNVGGIGLSIGLIVSVFPKCFLDLSSVDTASYPLALGLGNTVEGLFDFLTPILIGHMVDVSESYILPFSMIGGLSFLSGCLLVYVFRWSKRKHKV